jgi:hypothetical protein
MDVGATAPVYHLPCIFSHSSSPGENPNVKNAGLDVKKAWGATFFQSHRWYSPIRDDRFKISSSRYTKESPKSGDRISHIPAIETRRLQAHRLSRPEHRRLARHRAATHQRLVRHWAAKHRRLQLSQ